MENLPKNHRAKPVAFGSKMKAAARYSMRLNVGNSMREWEKSTGDGTRSVSIFKFRENEREGSAARKNGIFWGILVLGYKDSPELRRKASQEFLQ